MAGLHPAHRLLYPGPETGNRGTQIDNLLYILSWRLYNEVHITRIRSVKHRNMIPAGITQQEVRMQTQALPQYMRIAVDIAGRIASGELREGQRLSGRSALSSGYNVSPETVRKALKLLSDVGIVKTREGSGTVVLSAEKAGAYLETAGVRGEQVDLQKQLQVLFRQYTEMGKQIMELSTRLLEARATPLPAEQALPQYEIRVPEDSDKIGMTLGDLHFWQCTGATVAAIRRGQKVIISPGYYAEIRGGDVLVYIGAPECRAAVERLLGSGKTERTLFLIQEQIVRAIHGKELYEISKALGAKPGDISGVTAMTKGMTNRSYCFTCRGERYILRIPGEGTASFIDRQQEAEVYRAISGLGICDDLPYINPKNGLKVSRFLDGVRVCDPFREQDVVRCVKLMHRLHDLKLRVGHEFRLFEKIQEYEDLREGLPSHYPDYEETKQKVLSLREFVEAHKAPFVLTHMDAVPDNFLFHLEDGEEKLQLTDWEYAAMQDPHIDIAMFCCYSEYTKEHTDHLIDLYFSGEMQADREKETRGPEACTRETRAKIYCYIAAAGLLWSNWCEYKRQMGVEFGEYADCQYECAKTYYEIAAQEIGRIGEG